MLTELLPRSKNTSLSERIKLAYERNYIDERDFDVLTAIRNFIRNRYAHGKYSEIAGDVPLKVTMIKIRGSGAPQVTEANFTTNKIPALQVGQKSRHDAQFSLPTLQHILRIASSLIELHPTLQAAQPSSGA